IATPIVKLSDKKLDTVYEPSEDSYLFGGCFGEADLEILHTMKPRICLDIGIGSGIIIIQLVVTEYTKVIDNRLVFKIWASGCRDWFRRFKNNDFQLEDKERSGAPKKFQDEELEQLLDEDPSQTLPELGKILQVDESTVSKRLKGLGMIQKQGHRVPYELKPRDVERCFGTCELLFQRQKRKDFLHRIVIGDEKWIHYDNPKRRKSWGKPGADRRFHSYEEAQKWIDSWIASKDMSFFRRGIHKSAAEAHRILVQTYGDLSKNAILNRLSIATSLLARQREKSFLWRIMTGDEKWIYFDNRKRRKSWADRYQQQLRRMKKRPLYAQRHDKVILLHDNARPHVAKPVKTYLETLKWEVLPHPPYSPDMAPSDFHLLRSMAHGLADRRFHSYEEAQKWIDSWIASKDMSFFRRGIHVLPERWEKVVSSDGQYFK
ncbi:MOS1T transposase, partial [Pseudoatta argentina]